MEEGGKKDFFSDQIPVLSCWEEGHARWEVFSRKRQERAGACKLVVNQSATARLSQEPPFATTQAATERPHRAKLPY